MTKYGAIAGCALHVPPHDSGSSLEEMLHVLTHRVLADAQLGIEDVDGIVVAACDQLDGRAISIMQASGPVGGVGRDIVATPSSAEHALILGALRIASGQYRTQLVLSWSPVETHDIAETQRLAADPYFNRHLPLDDLASYALQASALEAGSSGLREAAIAIVARNRRNGRFAHPEYAADGEETIWLEAGRRLRWPLTEPMVTRPKAGAVALLLVSADFAAERGLGPVAWIQGMGWATEPSLLGDRDLATLPSLASAAQQAYAEAGVTSPRDAFDLAEVADPTPYQQLLALEGLGLCPREQWVAQSGDGTFARGGDLPVNVSGGALSFNPVYCAGLFRIAEAAQQIRGRAGAHQVHGARAALAHAASGYAMQYNSVIILSKDVAWGKQ